MCRALGTSVVVFRGALSLSAWEQGRAAMSELSPRLHSDRRTEVAEHSGRGDLHVFALLPIELRRITPKRIAPTPSGIPIGKNDRPCSARGATARSGCCIIRRWSRRLYLARNKGRSEPGLSASVGSARPFAGRDVLRRFIGGCRNGLFSGLSRSERRPPVIKGNTKRVCGLRLASRYSSSRV